MRMEEVDDRKKYVQTVRQSFEQPGKPYEWEENQDTKGEAADGFSFFKVRLLLSLFLFAAYVLCDWTGTAFYQYSTREITQKIEENDEYAHLLEEVAHFLPM